MKLLATPPSAQPFHRPAPTPADAADRRAGLSPGPSRPDLRRTPGCRVEVRATERESFTEYHVTGTIDPQAGVTDAAELLYGQLAAALAERGVQPIQEKVYGLARARPEVLKRRDAAYRRHQLETDIPFTWVQGVPLAGGDWVGVQIWGVSARGGSRCVTTFRQGGRAVGRLWNGRGFRMLHLAAVRGDRVDGSLAHGPAAQADQMFTNAELALATAGLAYSQVVRTWIYVSRLLDWYGDLNRVRNAHYERVGFGRNGGPAFPASTGIQGHTADEECLFDVLALETLDGRAAARPITRSPRQDASFNYGSAFSRGMTLDLEGRRTLHISGTASINTAGESTHLGDAEMQSLETLMSIAAILHEQGGTLENITSATLFCKTPEAWEAWNRVSRLLSLPAFPKICVQADVCRDNLLVEMEVVATI